MDNSREIPVAVVPSYGFAGSWRNGRRIKNPHVRPFLTHVSPKHTNVSPGKADVRPRNTHVRPKHAHVRQNNPNVRLFNPNVSRGEAHVRPGYFGLTMPGVSVKLCHFERSSKVG